MSCSLPEPANQLGALCVQPDVLTGPAQGHRCVSRSQGDRPCRFTTGELVNLDRCLVQGHSLHQYRETKPGRGRLMSLTSIRLSKIEDGLDCLLDGEGPHRC